MKDEKILQDELMSDEELDNVAGGTVGEMVKDANFLKAIGLLDRTYSAKDIKANSEGVASALTDAFSKADMYVEAGVDFKHSYGGTINGETVDGISRAQAYKAIADRVKPGFNYKKYL